MKMKSGQGVTTAGGVEVTLWDRAPLNLAPKGMCDPWWVTRNGPKGREMWLIARRRHEPGYYSLIGRYTWQGQLIHR